MSDLSGLDPAAFDGLVRRVTQAAVERLEHVATEAARSAQERAPQWRLINATIDPDSINGPFCEVYPDDNPDEAVQVVRLDPRQGIPDGDWGENNRTLILHTPPAGGFAFGLIPDEPEANDVNVDPAAYRRGLVIPPVQLTSSGGGQTATGDLDGMEILDAPTVPGRWYVFHCHTQVSLTNTAALWSLNLEVDGANFDRFALLHLPLGDLPGETFTWLIDSWVYWQAADVGPHEFVVNATEHAGAATLTRVASATVLSTFAMQGAP